MISEYRKTVPVSVSTIGGHGSSGGNGPERGQIPAENAGPTLASVRRVKLLLVLLLGSLYAQFFILESLKARRVNFEFGGLFFKWRTLSLGYKGYGKSLN